MKKIIFFFAAVIFCSTLLYSQAAVDIPLIVTDNITDSVTIFFGVDLNATNGIDTLLGEFNLLPWPPPPPSYFLAMFDLTPYIGGGETVYSYKDYRNAPSFPFTGQRQHRLLWQLGIPGTFLSILYNMPAYATLQIEDEFGGILVSSPILSGSGTFIITVPINAARLNIAYTNALPVELISFTGMQEGLSVKLNWTTGSEINNKGFDIERRDLYSDWETISFIEGHGTTTEMQEYSYTDDLTNYTSGGTLLYRLRQIDYDGTASCSKEIEVEIELLPDNFILYQNYPNPFNPVTAIKFRLPEEAKVNLSVYNLMGEKVKELKNEYLPQGSYEVKFDASSLSSGMYFYILNAGTNISTKKLTVLK